MVAIRARHQRVKGNLHIMNVRSLLAYLMSNFLFLFSRQHFTNQLANEFGFYIKNRNTDISSTRHRKRINAEIQNEV